MSFLPHPENKTLEYVVTRSLSSALARPINQLTFDVTSHVVSNLDRYFKKMAMVQKCYKKEGKHQRNTRFGTPKRRPPTKTQPGAKLTRKNLENYRFREPTAVLKNLWSLTSDFLTDLSKKWPWFTNVKREGKPEKYAICGSKRATAGEEPNGCKIGTKGPIKPSISGTHGGP